VKILCLEDAEANARELREIAQDSLGSADIEFVVVKSVIAAKEKVDQVAFDIALIDIVVPMREGERERKDGGIKFLDHIVSSPRAKRPRYVIGMTSDKETFAEASLKFGALLFQLIERVSGSDEWRSGLEHFFEYVAQLDRDPQQLRSPAGRVSMAVICALENPELEGVRQSFGISWTAISSENDPNSYLAGSLKAASGDHRILLVAAHEQGMSAAAALAAKIVVLYQPAVVAMTGIAAGLVKNAKLGDILIAEQTWDYTTGKLVTTDSEQVSLQPENRAVRCDPVIVDQVRRLSADRALLDAIKREFPAETPKHALSAYVGPIASGGAVVENQEIIKGVKTRDRKTIGLDMESHGIAVATRYAYTPATRFLIVKSVVDFGCPPKQNRWQPYASYTSASFLRSWATTYL
jgi:nucleoside phosphorylase/CheY-like chemotaxis protein